tara:strand:+ start:355 stop:2061 length:1707 start_codon:yes stop_codon:yes gene_type:complete
MKIFDALKLIKKQLVSSPTTTVVILVLSTLVGLLEAISIATLVPLFDIIIEGDVGDLTKYGFVNYFLERFEVELSISTVLFLFSSFILMKGIFSLVAMSYIGRVVVELALNMRKNFLSGLLKSNWPSLANKNSGEFLNSINHEIPKAASIYRYSCLLLGSSLQLAALIYVLYTFSTFATYGGIFLAFLLYIVLGGFIRLSNEQAKNQADLTNSLMTRIHELLGSIKVIKAMNLSQFILPVMLSEAKEIKKAEQKQIIATHGLNYLREPIVVIFLCIGLFIIIENKFLDDGLLVATLVLFLRLTQSIGKLQSDYQTFVVNSHFYRSFNNKLQIINDNEEKQGTNENILFKESLEFKKINFSHDSGKLLHDIDLKLPNKGFISITGESGSGKTTLIDMLIGLYEPSSGSISMDGKSLKQVGFNNIRSQVGYVQQDPFIFNESVLINVGLTDKSIGKEDIYEALKASRAESFVESMDNGLDTILGEGGSKISGGQKQRISIARALARKPSILILDEATSALDKKTMLDILEIMKRVSKQILVIAITHQQEVLEASDKTYRLENFKLKELRS